MSEFFSNIGNWFTSNWEPILAFLTSGTLGSIAVCIVNTVKTVKTAKQSKMSTDALNMSLQEVSLVKTSVDTMSNKVQGFVGDIDNFKNNLLDNVKNVVDDVSNFKSNITEVVSSYANKINDVNSKIDGILDVMNIAYSTIRDDSVRNNINNIITTTKYNLTATETEKQIKEEELAEVKALLEVTKRELTEKLKEVEIVGAQINTKKEELLQLQTPVAEQTKEAIEEVVTRV